VRVAHQEMAAHAQQVTRHHQRVPQQLHPNHNALFYHDEDQCRTATRSRFGIRDRVIPQSQTFSLEHTEYIL